MKASGSRKSGFFAAVAVAVLLLPAGAVLPPSEYVKMQEAAPEALEIEVLAVVSEPGEELNEEIIRVTAVTTKIERSAAGIKRGDFLQIVYTVRTKPDGMLGREEIPVLAEGAKTVAFLRSEEGTPFFVPAAGAMSFNRF